MLGKEENVLVFPPLPPPETFSTQELGGLVLLLCLITPCPGALVPSRVK